MLRHKIARPDVGQPRGQNTRKKEKTAPERIHIANGECKSRGNLRSLIHRTITTLAPLMGVGPLEETRMVDEMEDQ